jgi:hypothetical protein
MPTACAFDAPADVMSLARRMKRTGRRTIEYHQKFRLREIVRP